MVLVVSLLVAVVGFLGWWFCRPAGPRTAGGAHRAPQLPSGTVSEPERAATASHLAKLRGALLGDHARAERLVELELARDPSLDREGAAQAALELLRRDLER